MYTKLDERQHQHQHQHLHRLSTESISRLSTTSSRTGITTAGRMVFSGGLSMRNGHFVDQHGRVRLLRGVNLGGSSKLPANYAHVDPLPCSLQQFFDGAASVSFVNRPFPLQDADFHFARLRKWGLTLLRVIVTWEAIEHAGPGQYDHEYLQYMRALMEKANEYGMQIYIDPHQDVWSRWTGGDGAPMWTLECVGLEPRHFEATKAAICVETSGKPVTEFPKMIWPTNYYKLAAATMFTLFWAGKKFAPSCFVDGVQVQEYLQSHYVNALTELAKALADLPNIVGFGTMNEPSSGYIGTTDIAAGFSGFTIKNGFAPTPLQGMLLGEGIPQDVEVWSNGLKHHVLGKPDSVVHVDPQGKRAWKEGKRCVWLEEGVWTMDAEAKPQLLKPDHFTGAHFGNDCFLPFAKRYAAAVQKVLPNAMIFVEMPPGAEGAPGAFPPITSENVPYAVNAMHWYDLMTLFTQSWIPRFSIDLFNNKFVFGRDAVRKLHETQLHHVKQVGRVHMNNAPTLVGETGIAFNLSKGKAYRTGDYSEQVEALNHTISCLESQLLSYTLWCYTADNHHTYGDLWNLEDLSIVNDQHAKADATGGSEHQPLIVGDSKRGTLAFARPHAISIAGTPTKSTYALERRCFELEFTADLQAQAPTEIHVPHVQYPLGYNVTTSQGRYEVQQHDEYDVLKFFHYSRLQVHHITLTTKDASVDAQWKRQQLMQKVLWYAAYVFIAGLLLWLVVA